MCHSARWEDSLADCCRLSSNSQFFFSLSCYTRGSREESQRTEADVDVDVVDVVDVVDGVDVVDDVVDVVDVDDVGCCIGCCCC